MNKHDIESKVNNNVKNTLYALGIAAIGLVNTAYAQNYSTKVPSEIDTAKCKIFLNQYKNDPLSNKDEQEIKLTNSNISLKPGFYTGSLEYSINGNDRKKVLRDEVVALVYPKGDNLEAIYFNTKKDQTHACDIVDVGLLRVYKSDLVMHPLVIEKGIVPDKKHSGIAQFVRTIFGSE